MPAPVIAAPATPSSHPPAIAKPAAAATPKLRAARPRLRLRCFGSLSWPGLRPRAGNRG
jgi:hypothetical protein